MTERKDKPCGTCGGSEMITTAFDPYTEEGGVTKPCGTCGGSGIKPFVRYYNCIHCGKDVSEDHLITVSRNECKDRCPTCKNKVIAKSTCSKCSPDCQPAEKPCPDKCQCEKCLARKAKEKLLMKKLRRSEAEATVAALHDDEPAEECVTSSEARPYMSIVWCLTHRNPLSHCIQKKQEKQIADLKAKLEAAEKILNRFPDYFAYEREYKKLESRIADKDAEIERLKKGYENIMNDGFCDANARFWAEQALKESK